MKSARDHADSPRQTSPPRGRSGRRTRKAVRRFMPALLRRKLRTLSDRWDRERSEKIAETTVAVGGAVLGIFLHRAFFLLPLGAAVYRWRRPIRKWAPRMLFLGRILVRIQAFRLRMRSAVRSALA